MALLLLGARDDDGDNNEDEDPMREALDDASMRAEDDEDAPVICGAEAGARGARDRDAPPLELLEDPVPPSVSACCPASGSRLISWQPLQPPISSIGARIKEDSIQELA